MCVLLSGGDVGGSVSWTAVVPVGMLRRVSGANDAAVDEASRRGEFEQHRGGVGRVGVVEDPAEELGPLAQRRLSALGDQETAPLDAGQVTFEQGEDAALLVVEVVAQGLAEGTDR